MDIGQHTEFGGLHRAARIAAGIAGAPGPEVEEIADEVMARLLMQDGPVNNPRAWVRRTATQLAAQAPRLRLQVEDVLRDLSPSERTLVVGHRAGLSTRELADRVGLPEEAASLLLAEANRQVRRSSRRLSSASR